MDCSSVSNDRLLDHALGGDEHGERIAGHLAGCRGCSDRMDDVLHIRNVVRMAKLSVPEALDVNLRDALGDMAMDLAARRNPTRPMTLRRSHLRLGLAFAAVVIAVGVLVWPWSRQAERAGERRHPERHAVRTPVQPSGDPMQELSVAPSTEEWVVTEGLAPAVEARTVTRHSELEPLSVAETTRSKPVNWTPEDTEPAPIQTGPAGDVSRNGRVGAEDVLLLSRALVSDGEIPEEADFNGDGQVDMADLLGLVDQLLEEKP